MKKLDKLILKSFLGPLLLTFAIAVFVLLMQFVWKYIDDLVGKGLEFSVIAQLLLYASATFVPMALPIAVLFASIMTMGNFGEKYELIAIKAGGISLRRVMMPMAFVAVLLTLVAFYFGYLSWNYLCLCSSCAWRIGFNDYDGFRILYSNSQLDRQLLVVDKCR